MWLKKQILFFLPLNKFYVKSILAKIKSLRVRNCQNSKKSVFEVLTFHIKFEWQKNSLWYMHIWIMAAFRTNHFLNLFSIFQTVWCDFDINLTAKIWFFFFNFTGNAKFCLEFCSISCCICKFHDLLLICFWYIISWNGFCVLR